MQINRGVVAISEEVYLVLKSKFIKHREVLAYLFFGVLTTLLNIVIFMVSFQFMDDIVANTLAFFIAVQFAYYTNTRYVFQTPFTKQNLLKFWGMRIGTILIDNAGMWLLLSWNCDRLIAKCGMNILIIVFNYILSKYIVYLKK